MTFSRQSTLNALHRLLAAGAAALVLALGLMSVSPALHEWVHAETCEHSCDSTSEQTDHQPLSSEHDCAVVWFANGLTVALDPITPDRAPEAQRAEQFHGFEQLLLSRVSNRLPPGRAPPQV